jgi:hypothetical protein
MPAKVAIGNHRDENNRTRYSGTAVGYKASLKRIRRVASIAFPSSQKAKRVATLQLSNEYHYVNLIVGKTIADRY